MKIFFLLPVINLLVVSPYTDIQLSSTSQIDTTSIIHVLDGNLTEWPQEKFTIDKTTKVGYAIDNDGQMLFIAISISDKIIQKKIIQDGMNLYIDTKGKKKENRGIEFPVKMEKISSTDNMKLFGFSTATPFVQNIKTEGTANIATGWDSSSVLHIEYNIPLKILEGSVTELNNKKISIGWKFQENEMPGNNTAPSTSSQPVYTTSTLVGVPAGSKPPSSTNRNAGTTQNNTFPQPNTSKAQVIWTTHTINF